MGFGIEVFCSSQVLWKLNIGTLTCKMQLIHFDFMQAKRKSNEGESPDGPATDLELGGGTEVVVFHVMSLNIYVLHLLEVFINVKNLENSGRKCWIFSGFCAGEWKLFLIISWEELK